jgi:hypothetical protein
MIWNKKKNKDNKESGSFKGTGLLASILCFLFVAAFFWSAWFMLEKNSPEAQAQTAPAAETGKDDGIAVRVMANGDHLSPLTWYKKNIKQQGSPSALKVDGYEAAQEGRTVYVNAGNVSGTDLFTNIYILSYTQNTGADTQNIFKQLLDNWTFNANVIASAPAGECRQIKNNVWVSEGSCYTDSQCAAGFWCGSEKAQITRDVRRLADLQEIKLALENYSYKKSPTKGYCMTGTEKSNPEKRCYKTSECGTGNTCNYKFSYPDLAAGSYLAGKTISVWPSWQKTLGAALGVTLPADPINKLADCDDPNKDGTCWHESEKRFGDLDGVNLKHHIPDKLPVASYIYAYTKENGICAIMETDYAAVDSSKCAAGVAALGSIIVTPLP